VSTQWDLNPGARALVSLGQAVTSDLTPTHTSGITNTPQRLPHLPWPGFLLLRKHPPLLIMNGWKQPHGISAS
jgi:hypothetical protein